MKEDYKEYNLLTRRLPLRIKGMRPILGHELDKKRGNVFYDVKISYLRNDPNGTLFDMEAL